MEVEGSWCILWAGTDREEDDEEDTSGENALAVGTDASAAAAEQQRTAAVVFMVQACASEEQERLRRGTSGYEPVMGSEPHGSGAHFFTKHARHAREGAMLKRERCREGRDECSATSA